MDVSKLESGFSTKMMLIFDLTTALADHLLQQHGQPHIKTISPAKLCSDTTAQKQRDNNIVRDAQYWGEHSVDT